VEHLVKLIKGDPVLDQVQERFCNAMRLYHERGRLVHGDIHFNNVMVKVMVVKDAVADADNKGLTNSKSMSKTG
jgi:aminoglycoside phosphotransferase (APT) family kinase protein